jgi:SAM-dependent methyltransferase
VPSIAKGSCALAEELFDLSEQYEEMLRMGVSLSGEEPAYFMKGRIDDLVGQLPTGWKPARILDFGCGTGESSAYLAQKFPGAHIVGVDTSASATNLATERHGSTRIEFGPIQLLQTLPSFELCYVNGVFHHIEPERRAEALRTVFNSVGSGGYLGLFENNPWNPGTRLVMSRIPFDRGAQTLSYRVAEKLVTSAGFRLAVATRFLFYFPRSLAMLRFTETALRSVPLGAQYYVLAVKP